MILLVTGVSHTGKTNLAQKLLETYKIPYLSMDLLKMGLIRSKQTHLTVEQDEEMTLYLWGIVKELIKTAIENHQHLIVEGIYIPFTWKDDFNVDDLKEIKYCCLVMSETYIHKHFENISKYANVIQNRIDDSGLSMPDLLNDNLYNLEQCKKYNFPYYLINDIYDVDINLFK